MKNSLKAAFLLAMLFAVTILSSCAKKAEQSDGEAKYYDFGAVTEIKEGQKNIYVVLKVLNSQYWQDITDGITDAGNELNCNIYVGGPESESDWQTQAMMINKAVNEAGADAIIVSPANSTALSETINGVHQKGIPVILVDTILNSNDFDICYMTDNLKAGESAAQEMIRQLKAGGVSENDNADIAIQITSVSSQTVIDRLAGFNQYWASNAPKNWHVLDEVKLNDGDKDRAKQNGLDFINEYPDIKGMFACNNSSTVGFVNSLNECGRNDIVLVGFDYADETAALVASDKHHVSTIVQNQYNMGYEGLKTAVSILDGDPAEYKFIDTGIIAVNHDNQPDYENS